MYSGPSMSSFYGGSPPLGSPAPNSLNVGTDPLNDKTPPAVVFVAVVIIALVAIRLLYELAD